MIGGHPGGVRLTERLLKLKDREFAAKDREKPETATDCHPGKALDLGAGPGHSVRYLRALGYDAEGIDRKPEKEMEDTGERLVLEGDMTALFYPDASFDLCLAECSISVCGDGPAALQEAYRILRPGGSLLLSDVFFRKQDAPCLSMPGPLTKHCWEVEIVRAGFVIAAAADETALWREFFLESLWNDNADETFCSFFSEAGKAGCGYFLAWLKKT